MHSYNDPHTNRLAVRLLLSMSMEDAREVMGFPPGSSPSPVEIQKAYKKKVFENHPDRGGDPKKMVEVNVAKEILEGKRRQDRTPYTRPEKDPETVKREQAAKKLSDDLRSLKEEEEDVLGYLKFTLARSAPDLTRGGGLVDMKEFLVDDYADALEQLSNEAEELVQSDSKNADAKKAEALCQTLTSKALRLASKFAALKKKRAVIVVGAGSTLDEVRTLVKDTAAFIKDWQALYTESGKLMTLIVTSEKVPMSWDDLYSHSHQRIVSYNSDFKPVNDKDFKDFEKQLKDSLKTVGEILKSYDQNMPSEGDWKTPSSYQTAREAIAARGPKFASSADRVAAKFRADR